MLIRKILNKNRTRAYKILDILPDRLVIKVQHYLALRRKLELKEPLRFTDKIQWYKLNYRHPLMTICADKYRVREYLNSKGLSRYSVKVYQTASDFNEIDFSVLPNKFAIKSNNGSGTNIFITEKNILNQEYIKKTLLSWSKVNTLSVGREWAYKNIDPLIVIEELLEPNDEFQKIHGLNDYKFLCFNGKPTYVWVDSKRETNHHRDFYDLNWNLLDVTSDKPRSKDKILKPEGFDQMIRIATNISRDFPFIRVDFYSINGNIYIGELTFYPWSGIVKFFPDTFDYKLGELFTLPN